MATARMTISSWEKLLLKVLPVCLPPWAVEGIRHDFEDDNIVMYRSALGEAAAFRGSPGESGDAAEPARQLFPDNHVFLRIEGLSFIVRHGQQDFQRDARFTSSSVRRDATIPMLSYSVKSICQMAEAGRLAQPRP